MEGRVTYSEIRSWFLDSYYNYCRAKLSHKSPWVEGESEVGYAYGELENSFESPVEKLMLEVLALVLAAGRLPVAVEKFHLDAIRGLLNEFELPYILDNLSSEEAGELKGDLGVLGFL